MTAALRSIDCTPTADAVPAPVDHTHAALIAENARLQIEIRHRAALVVALRRELTRAIEAPTVVGERVVDGMLTVTLSTGAIMQRRPRVIDTPQEFSYGFEWVLVEAVAGCAAQIVDSSMADLECEPLHYASAQQRLVRARMYGMAVTGGAD